jgi:hypothetical protein
MPKIPDLPPTYILTRIDSIPVYTPSDSNTHHTTLDTLYNSVCSEMLPVFATNNRVSALELKQNENIVTKDIVNTSNWTKNVSSKVDSTVEWLSDLKKNVLNGVSTVVTSNSGKWTDYDTVTSKIAEIDLAVAPVKTTIVTTSGVQSYSINGWDFNKTTNPNNYLVIINGLIQNADTDYTIVAPTQPGQLAKIQFTNTITSTLTCTVLSHRTVAGTKEGIDGITVLKNGSIVNSYGIINTVNFIGDSTTIDIVGNNRQANVNISDPASRGFVKGLHVSTTKNLETATVTGVHLFGAGLSSVHFENGVAEICFDKNTTLTSGFSGVAIADENAFITNGKGYQAINFIGRGVTARDGNSTTCIVEIPGISGVDLLKNNTVIGNVTRFNFVGDAFNISKSGETGYITVNSDGINGIQELIRGGTWVTNNSARLELDGYREMVLQGFNYTAVTDDKDKHIVYKGSNNITVMLPGTNLADTINKQLSIGSVIYFIQKGEGSITFVDSVGIGSSGSVIKSLNNKKNTAGQYAVVKAIKTEYGEWVLTGDLV